MRELRPGIARAAHGRARRSRTRSAPASSVLPKTPPLNRRLESLLQELQTFSNDPLVPRGIRRPTELVESLRPDARLPRADPDRLQLPDAVVPQHLLAASEGDRNGTWQRFIIVATPQGPNNEGGPSSGAGQRARRRATTSTSTRTRTPRRRASRASARPATSPTCAGRRSIGNVPGTQQARTEGYAEGDD